MNQNKQKFQTIYKETCEEYTSFLQGWNLKQILDRFKQAFKQSRKSIIQQLQIKNETLRIELQQTKLLMDQNYKKAKSSRDFFTITQFCEMAQYIRQKIKRISLSNQYKLVSDAMIELADKLITQQFGNSFTQRGQQKQEEQQKLFRSSRLQQFEKIYYQQYSQHLRGHQNWRKGINAIFEQRQSDCFQLLLKSTEYGNVGGLHVQGYCYEEGVGCQIDFQKAFHCYAKAAYQGNPTSLNNIGNFYQIGMPYLNKDIKKAIFYYELSAERGFGRACWNLGRLYMEGDEIQRDIAKAKWYFKRAIYLSLYDDILEKLDEIRSIQALQRNQQSDMVE